MVEHAMTAALCVAALLLTSGQSPREHVTQGYALAQKGDFAGAEKELREAVRLAPKDAVALAVLGMILSQRSNPEEANIYLDRALSLDPTDANTRYNLAFNEYRLGRMVAARANLEQVLRLRPDHTQATALLEKLKANGYGAALELYRAGKFAESRTILEGLTDAQSMMLLAWCHHREGHEEPAAAAMRKALLAAPTDAGLYVSAGQILLEEKRLTGAEEAARKALKFSPEHAGAWKLRGAVELEYGNLKAAAMSFQRAARVDASDADTVALLGNTQRMLFRYDEAAVTLRSGVGRFPRSARLYEVYGRVLADRGDARAASMMLEKALALDPGLPEAHEVLGRLLAEDGKIADAITHLEAAVRANPANASTHLALAKAYRMAGRIEDQQRELRKFRELGAASRR